MPSLLRWPRCPHMNLLFQPEQCLGPDGLYHYEVAVCAQCGRPVVRFVTKDVPPRAIRDTRRHLAWWNLGKAHEHAGNTLVLP